MKTEKAMKEIVLIIYVGVFGCSAVLTAQVKYRLFSLSASKGLRQLFIAEAFGIFQRIITSILFSNNVNNKAQRCLLSPPYVFSYLACFSPNPSNHIKAQ